MVIPTQTFAPQVLPIYEPGLDEVVRACRGRNLFFSTDCRHHIAKANIIFVRYAHPQVTEGIVLYGPSVPLLHPMLASGHIAALWATAWLKSLVFVDLRRSLR